MIFHFDSPSDIWLKARSIKEVGIPSKNLSAPKQHGFSEQQRNLPKMGFADLYAPNGRFSPIKLVDKEAEEIMKMPRIIPRHLLRSAPVKETASAKSHKDANGKRVINQYEVVKTIGRGSYGIIYLVIDRDTQKQYAMKEMSKRLLRRHRRHTSQRSFESGQSLKQLREMNLIYRSHLDRIKEEIAIMKKLNHPNIVHLIEVLDDDREDSLFLILELCQKGPIMQVGPNSVAEPYSEGECLTFFRSLFLAIEYLHSNGIAHRDIKPENLLLTENDTIKVSDFGISEMFKKENNFSFEKYYGSPAFMAPEFLNAHTSTYSMAKADIWAMGITLYCLRFGKLPFNQESSEALLLCIRDDDIEIPSDTNQDLADLLRALLTKDPESRINLSDIRSHPWMSSSNEVPLISSEENICSNCDSVSMHEVQGAIQQVQIV